MKTEEEIFGHGEDITVMQLIIRAVSIFIIALILIRVSGRRSFGMKMPFDNVITILLGSILARGATGASSILTVTISSVVIVVLHRVCAMLAVKSHSFGQLIKGNPELLYRYGNYLKYKMKRYDVSERDLMEGVRLNGNVDSLEKIKEVYIERNGEISVVKED